MVPRILYDTKPHVRHQVGKRGQQHHNGAEAPSATCPVVGLGLIGASLAAALKKAFPGAYVHGVDVDSRSCVVAKERGWVDDASKPDADEFRAFLTDMADLVVIATPIAAVDDYMHLLSELDYKASSPTPCPPRPTSLTLRRKCFPTPTTTSRATP